MVKVECIQYEGKKMYWDEDEYSSCPALPYFLHFYMSYKYTEFVDHTTPSRYEIRVNSEFYDRPFELEDEGYPVGDDYVGIYRRYIISEG